MFRYSHRPLVSAALLLAGATAVQAQGLSVGDAQALVRTPTPTAAPAPVTLPLLLSLQLDATRRLTLGTQFERHAFISGADGELVSRLAVFGLDIRY